MRGTPILSLATFSVRRNGILFRVTYVLFHHYDANYGGENLSMTRTRQVFRSLIFVFLLATLPAQAAEPQTATQQTSEEELVKQTQNPVADLISVPLQNNFNFGTGSKNRTVYVGNIQPVIPIHITDDWNLITRTIMPIINQPSLFPGMDSATGLGDINPTFFFSPAKSGELIWGVGPTFTLPTATDSLIGSGKFSMGPAAVALTIQGHWVVGALANNQWSVAGWGKNNVNSFLLQPFVNYNLPDHWYLVSAPIMTANWAAAKGGDVWTVPLGGGVGKLFRLGEIIPLEGHAIAKLPINTQLQAFGNVHRPEFGSEWQLRFQVQLLFPK
jgi:hypothetical protein